MFGGREEGVTLEELKRQMADFAKERDWDRFHSPRNLLLAMVGEVGELSEIFQWKGEVPRGLPGWKDEEKQHLGEELSDVLLYLVRLSDICGVDLGKAALRKMELNAIKYPPGFSKASFKKPAQNDDEEDEEMEKSLDSKSIEVKSNTIELKVVNGEDLKVYNYFQKPTVFCQVSIVSDDPKKEVESQTQRTATVKEDVGQPQWNHKMRFSLNDSIIDDHTHLSLHFDLLHEGLVFGNKPIGEVRMAFRDLLESTNRKIRYVSREVRSPDGKANGCLNFSYKVYLRGRDFGLGKNMSLAAGNKGTDKQDAKA